MAKKNDTAYEKFLADLREINPAIEELIKDDRVSAKLKEGVLARADYSSHMDELKTQREAFATEVEEARTKIQGWQNWYKDVTTDVTAMRTQLDQYVDTYGELTESGKRAVAREAGLSKAEFEKALNEEINRRDLANLKFADDLTDIKIDYRDRFKEKLDTASVYKIAGEKGCDLTTAYNYHIADRVKEQEASSWEAKIKSAKEEAVAEYASKHNLPVVPSTSDMVHVLDSKDAPITQRDRVQAALADFNKSRQQ